MIWPLQAGSNIARGGGVNETRAFQRVPEFARCYAEALKRWIEIGSNAELIKKQWQDPRGWPDGCPALALEDFAWGRERWDDERTKLWVPMLRLPFCEIGIDMKSGEFLTNGLLPSEKNNDNWLFDQSGAIATVLKGVAAEQLTTA